MSLYSREAFKSGKWVAVLWKSFDEPDWDGGVFWLFEGGMSVGADLLRGVESRLIVRV
jgi:hypothetical protein